MVNVVIADDHELVRQAISHMLSTRTNFKVTGQANDGQQLLDLLQAQTPDIVILDLNMPNLDGLGALEKIKQNNNNVPVLVLSSDDGGPSIRSAFKAGAKGYMPKNAQSEELFFAIQAVIDGKTYVSPAVVGALIEPANDAAAGENPFKVLSKREYEIVQYLAHGKPNREIAGILHISIRTVDTHRTNIMKKLKLKTNGELVKLALQHGVIEL